MKHIFHINSDGKAQRVFTLFHNFNGTQYKYDIANGYGVVQIYDEQSKTWKLMR